MYFGDAFHRNKKFGAFALFTFNFDLAAHLLYQVFANWKTQANTMGVLLLMFVDFAKIDEKGVDLVFWDSYSRVFDDNIKTEEA